MKKYFFLLLYVSICFSQDTLELIYPINGFNWYQRDIFNEEFVGDSLKEWGDSLRELASPGILIHGTDTLVQDWEYYMLPFDTSWSIEDTFPAIWDLGYFDRAMIDFLEVGNITIDSSDIICIEVCTEDTIDYRTWLFFDRAMWYHDPYGGTRFLGVYSQGTFVATWQEQPYKPVFLYINP